MPTPEQPAAQEQPDTPPRKDTQPLYIRMFFRKHMTDLVRAFGYEELSREEAKRRVQALIDTYGDAEIRSATEEIVELTPDGSAWRLTERARTLAVGILGRPKPPQKAVPSEPAKSAKAANAPPKSAPQKRRPKKRQS